MKLSNRVIKLNDMTVSDLKLNFKAYFEIKKKFNINIQANDDELIEQLLDSKVSFEIFKKLFDVKRITITDDDIYEIIETQFDGELEFLIYNMCAFMYCVDKTMYKKLVEQFENKGEVD